MLAPEYWKPSNLEPQWTYDLYYKYMNKESEYQGEYFFNEEYDELKLDLREIENDLNLKQM